MCAKSLQLCPALCDPMDCSLPSSSVHGDSPGKSTGVGCHALTPGDLPHPGIKPVSLMSPALQVGSLPPVPYIVSTVICFKQTRGLWRHGFNPWVRKMLWRRAWHPTAVLLPGESPWTEELGGLQSMGWQRAGHD